jgi:hypothetical protein
MKPEHGPIKISERANPSTVCHVCRADSEEKKNPAPLKDLLGLFFFFFLPFVTLLPLIYKREGRAPH